LIHRRNELRASKILRERARKNPKIEIVWNKVVEEFIGDKTLAAIKLKDTVTHGLSTLEVAGAFEAIGHRPNTEFLKGQVTTDEVGYIVTKPGSTATSKEGVFAAGDVQDPRYRQAITSAASGCMAALEVEWWLQDRYK
jgi:thioredoxin reductase (NADPH)